MRTEMVKGMWKVQKDTNPEELPKFGNENIRVDGVLRVLPVGLRQTIFKYAFFAGGSVAASQLVTDFQDYDLYFHSQEDYKAFTKELKPYCGLDSMKGLLVKKSINQYFDEYVLLRKMWSTSNHAWYFLPSLTLQAIGFLSGTPLSVIERFDLSCCQAAYSPQSKEYTVTQPFKDTIMTRKATVENYLTPLKTANRMLKYIDRGISFDYGELLKMQMVLETEPEATEPHKSTPTNPFDGITYDGVGYKSKKEILELLDKAMEKTDD